MCSAYPGSVKLRNGMSYQLLTGWHSTSVQCIFRLGESEEWDVSDCVLEGVGHGEGGQKEKLAQLGQSKSPINPLAHPFQVPAC